LPAARQQQDLTTAAAGPAMSVRVAQDHALSQFLCMIVPTATVSVRYA
jgi:hypothetical protein